MLPSPHPGMFPWNLWHASWCFTVRQNQTQPATSQDLKFSWVFVTLSKETGTENKMVKNWARVSHSCCFVLYTHKSEFMVPVDLLHWRIKSLVHNKRHINCGSCRRAVWNMSPENNELQSILVCVFCLSGIRTNTRRRLTCWMTPWPSGRRLWAGTIQLWVHGQSSVALLWALCKE